MVAIKEAIDIGIIKQTKISCVICNEPSASGIKKAQDLGLRTQILNHRDFASRELFDEELANKLDEFDPNLIILAGFMRILSEKFTARFKGKILNIHPSLLPKYPGLNTHEKALKNKDQEHGVTIHFVNEELDGGPVIAQGYLTIGESKDSEALRKRIHKIEHDLYPKIIDAVISNEIKLTPSGTFYKASCQNYIQRVFYAV